MRSSNRFICLCLPVTSIKQYIHNYTHIIQLTSNYIYNMYVWNKATDGEGQCQGFVRFDVFIPGRLKTISLTQNWMKIGRIHGTPTIRGWPYFRSSRPVTARHEVHGLPWWCQLSPQHLAERLPVSQGQDVEDWQRDSWHLKTAWVVPPWSRGNEDFPDVVSHGFSMLIPLSTWLRTPLATGPTLLSFYLFLLSTYIHLLTNWDEPPSLELVILISIGCWWLPVIGSKEFWYKQTVKYSVSHGTQRPWEIYP